MKKSEKNALLKWAKGLTNEELKEEYYDAVYNSLGSLTENMYELGYDIRDIEEQENTRSIQGEKSDILCFLCKERGIKLWEKSK